MKPSKETVFEMVRKTKQAATEYHELKAKADKLDAIPYNLNRELEKAAYKASELNKQLKSTLALFTEEERNEMRETFNK